MNIEQSPLGSTRPEEIPARPTRKLKDFIDTFGREYELYKREQRFYGVADHLQKFFDKLEQVQANYPFVGETIDNSVPSEKLTQLEEAITFVESAAQNGTDFRLRQSEQTTYDPGYSFSDSISGGVAGSSSTARRLKVYWHEPQSQEWKDPSGNISDERELSLLSSSYEMILEKLSDQEKGQLEERVQDEIIQLKKSGTYEDAVKKAIQLLIDEQEESERRRLAEEMIKQQLIKRAFVRMLYRSIGSRFDEQPGLLAGTPAQEIILSDLQQKRNLLKRIAEKRE